MEISNSIYEFILELLNETGGVAEIGRNDLAGQFSCVPSQINYVLSTRFTPERGFLVESRRGGGGFIRITKVAVDAPSSLLPVINCIGDSITVQTALYFIGNLTMQKLITEREAALLKAAVTDNSIAIAGIEKNRLRASIFKNMLISLHTVKH